MKTAFHYAWRYKLAAIIALVFMLVELISEIVQPLFMAKMINDGLLTNDLHSIATWGVWLFVLTLISFLSGIINSFFSAHVAQGFSYDVRRVLYTKIQSFTMATYLTFPTSALITRLTNDVNQVQSIIFMLLRIALKAPLLAVGSLAMAFIVNAKMALILCVSAPFLVLFLVWMITKGISLFARVQGRLDTVNKHLQEGLQAVRLIKAYMRGTYEEKRFWHAAKSLKIDTVQATRVMELALPVLQLVMNSSLLVVIWLGAQQIAANEMLAGDLVAVVNYAFRITGAFSMFSFIIIVYARAKASAERIEEVLLTKGATEDINTDIPKLSSLAITFDHVTFAYPNTDNAVLQDVSFTVQAGEKIAIMGATGAGKTTILQLVEHFYTVTDGSVRINHVPINQIPLSQLRHSIAYVPQQSLLFSGTIFDNLRWGKRNATVDELIRATTKAQIHPSIERFEHGYNTMIGQKGVNLSGGQKQRLAIARALLRESPLLILDDSTSALDVETEQKLWQALDQEQMTMLVVTQKIQTAKTADRVLLLDNGRVAGFAPHDELCQTNTLYRHIAASQSEVN